MPSILPPSPRSRPGGKKQRERPCYLCVAALAGLGVVVGGGGGGVAAVAGTVGVGVCVAIAVGVVLVLFPVGGGKSCCWWT